MADLTAAEKLTEAENALHAIVTGKRAEAISYGERRVQFTTANVAELRKYIAQLKAEIDPLVRRRPFGVYY